MPLIWAPAQARPPVPPRSCLLVHHPRPPPSAPLPPLRSPRFWPFCCCLHSGPIQAFSHNPFAPLTHPPPPLQIASLVGVYFTALHNPSLLHRGNSKALEVQAEPFYDFSEPFLILSEPLQLFSNPLRALLGHFLTRVTTSPPPLLTPLFLVRRRSCACSSWKRCRSSTTSWRPTFPWRWTRR